MKKLFLNLIVVCFASLSWGQQLNVSIDKINSNSLKVGDTVLINLNVEQYLQPISSFQIFFEFDQNVLDFVKTKNVNDLFSSQWRDNINENYFVGLYIDYNKVGLTIDNDDIICQLQFVYKGGDSDLSWSRSTDNKENSKVKGITKFLNSQNEPIDLNLIDGCVCKQ